MRGMILAMALAAVSRSCGGSGDREAPPPIDVTGPWEVSYRFEAERSELPRQLRLDLAQTGFTVTGVVTDPVSTAFVSGRLEGQNLTLDIGPISASKGLSYSLSARCTLDSMGRIGSGVAKATLRQADQEENVMGWADLARLPRRNPEGLERPGHVDPVATGIESGQAGE